MSNWWKSSALIACGLVLAATPAVADKPKAKSSAETGLIGIKLYDAGLKVIKIYGTPDEIQAVGFGGGGTAFGGGGGGAGVASRAEAAAVRPRLVLGAAAVVQERALLEAAASLRAEPALPILSTLLILVTK